MKLTEKIFDKQPAVKVFGGVIFTRSDRSDINTLIDLTDTAC